MFLLSIFDLAGAGNSGGMVSAGLGRGASVGRAMLANKYGQGILGAIATSPIGDYETEYREKMGEIPPIAGFGSKAVRFLRNNLSAFGYWGLIIGPILKWAKNKIFPTKEKQEATIIDNLIGIFTGIITYVVPILTAVAQFFGFHLEYALGADKAAKLQKAAFEKEGKIFIDMDMKKIHDKAKYLKTVLTYPRSVHAKVFRRSSKDRDKDIIFETAFIHGPSGTGKTTAATVILSNWANQKVEQCGFVPTVKMLPMREITERARKLQDIDQGKGSLVEAVDEDLGRVARSKKLDPLLVFGLLIKDIEDGISALAERNKVLAQSGKPLERVAFLIDEYDKLGELIGSTSDDNGENLKGILTRLNALLEQKDSPIIITANKSIEQIEKELDAVCPKKVDKKVWHDSVVVPHRRRLEMVEIYIGEPSTKVQSEIAAKYLLSTYPKDLIDICYGDGDSQFKVELVDNEQTNIDRLAKVIESEITSQHGSNQLNGSYVEHAVVRTILPVMADLAEEERSKAESGDGKRLGYTDEEWDDSKKVGVFDKARAAGIKVNLPMLRKYMQEVQRDRLRGRDDDTSSPDLARKNKSQTAKDIVRAFVRQNKPKLAPDIEKFLSGKIDDARIIELLEKIYTKESEGVYSSYSDVPIQHDKDQAQVSYKHCLRIDTKRNIVQVGYVSSSANVGERKGFSVIDGMTITDEIPLKEFLGDVLGELFVMFGKPKTYDIFELLTNVIGDYKRGVIDPSNVRELVDALNVRRPPS